MATKNKAVKLSKSAVDFAKKFDKITELNAKIADADTNLDDWRYERDELVRDLQDEVNSLENSF